MTMTFEEKVKAMTAKEVIDLMVDSILNPVIKLDLGTYGQVRGRICYGCAATNAVCKISGVVFDETNIKEWHHAEAVNAPFGFVSHFEDAIDTLRSGGFRYYNGIANKIGMAQINFEGFRERLSYLDNDFTAAELDVYKRLADFQEQK